MKKMILTCKRITLLLLLAALTISAAGCAESHADTPAFSTSHDRNTGFVPKTFQQQHETNSTAASEISDKVDNGMDAVEQKAEQMSENLEKAEK